MYNLHLHIQCNDIHVRVFMKLELHIRNINKSIKLWQSADPGRMGFSPWNFKK